MTRSKTTMTARRFRLMAPIYLRQWLVPVTGIPCVPLTTKARLRTTWSPLAPVTKKFQRGTYVVSGSLSNRPVCTCAGSRVCSLMLRLMAPYFYYVLQSTQRTFSTDERFDVLRCSKLCLENFFWDIVERVCSILEKCRGFVFLLKFLLRFKPFSRLILILSTLEISSPTRRLLGRICEALGYVFLWVSSLEFLQVSWLWFFRSL